jgi:NTP pyrophosphatase (non-canonical NTP hydrolase)
MSIVEESVDKATLATEQMLESMRSGHGETNYVTLLRNLSREDIFDQIMEEIQRQRVKHGPQGEMFSQPTDMKSWILFEEVGEVAHALNEHMPIEEVRKELVQVAAVAVAWIEAIDMGKR